MNVSNYGAKLKGIDEIFEHLLKFLCKDCVCRTMFFKWRII